ncbi:hypothetical protein RFI_01315, partial [Reticulomyxa filosa]
FWKYRKVINGSWTKKVSGGSPNYESFPNNPQFRVQLTDKTNLRYLLEAPVKYSVNIQMFRCVNFNQEDTANDTGGQSLSSMKNNNNNADDNASRENKEQEDNAADEEVINMDNASFAEKKTTKISGKILNREHYKTTLMVATSGAYRYGVACIDVKNLEEGVYIVIISTFEPNQIGGFKFTVRSSQRIGFTPV